MSNVLQANASDHARNGSRVIETHLHGSVAEIAIARPDAANALNDATYDALSTALMRCRDDESIHAVVLTARGERAFSAGADLKDFPHSSVDMRWLQCSTNCWRFRSR